MQKGGAVMIKNNLKLIATHFSDYDVQFSEDKFFEILNPCGNENIRLEYVSDDEWTPYILCFSFQHWHMNDEEDIIEHINDIINGNLFSIEFFAKGNRRFGGDIDAQELQDLSYEALEQFTGYYGMSKLKDIADSFKVRGWHTEANFDAKFIIDEFGNITIKKL
jgi:hypothetical protein